MPDRALRKADTDTLVVQTGRDLERLARRCVPEERDPEGQTLTLARRMYRLRDQLSDEAWAAYEAWAAARDAYQRGDADGLAHRKRFYRDYAAVAEELAALAEQPADAEDGEGVAWVVAVAVAVLCGLIISC